MSLAFSQELGRAGLQPRRQSGQMKGALAPEAAGCNRTSIIRSILPNSAVNITLRNFKPDDFDALHEIDQASTNPKSPTRNASFAPTCVSAAQTACSRKRNLMPKMKPPTRQRQ